MALQFSTTLRDNMMGASGALTEVWNATIGTSAVLNVYTGSPPASCGTNVGLGTLLASITLATAAFSVASAGAMSLSTSPSATAGAGSSATPGCFRVLDGSAVVHIQGTAGISSGDLSFNGTITSGQTVTISSIAITAPGA